MEDCLESCGLAISSLCQFRFFVLKWMEENFVEKQISVFQRRIFISLSRLKQNLNTKEELNIKKSQKVLQIFQSIASQTPTINNTYTTPGKLENKFSFPRLLSL